MFLIQVFFIVLPNDIQENNKKNKYMNLCVILYYVSLDNSSILSLYYRMSMEELYTA